MFYKLCSLTTMQFVKLLQTMIRMDTEWKINLEFVKKHCKKMPLGLDYYGQ